MSGGQIKILLVEDNPGDALLMREALMDAGYGAFGLMHVERLSEAFERLDEESFDIILLDLSLPDSQGFDTFHKIHEHQLDVPIVILTGLNDEELAVRAVREGAQDYLVKGEISSEVLPRMLRYAIERHQLMVEMVDLQHQLLEAERTRVLAETAVAAAHEINQPLTVMMGNAQLILTGLIDDDEQARLLETIRDEGERISEIVKKMKASRRYVSKTYIKGIRMIDFEASAQVEAKDE